MIKKQEHRRTGVKMFVLKKNIQSVIDKASEKAFRDGIEHSENINELEKAKIRKGYEIQILELKSIININDMKHKKALALINEAIEKDRLADQKTIQAKEAVVKVDHIIKKMSDDIKRGGVDISDVKEDIEKSVQKLLEDQE
jgi:hypothetical protein